MDKERAKVGRRGSSGCGQDLVEVVVSGGREGGREGSDGERKGGGEEARGRRRKGWVRNY